MARRDADLLARVPIFAGLTKRHLRSVAGISREQQFQEREAIAEEGKPGDDFYVILSGQAKVVQRGRTIANLLGQTGRLVALSRSYGITSNAVSIRTLAAADRLFATGATVVTVALSADSVSDSLKVEVADTIESTSPTTKTATNTHTRKP